MSDLPFVRFPPQNLVGTVSCDRGVAASAHSSLHADAGVIRESGHEHPAKGKPSSTNSVQTTKIRDSSWIKILPNEVSKIQDIPFVQVHEKVVCTLIYVKIVDRLSEYSSMFWKPAGNSWYSKNTKKTRDSLHSKPNLNTRELVRIQMVSPSIQAVSAVNQDEKRGRRPSFESWFTARTA